MIVDVQLMLTGAFDPKVMSLELSSLKKPSRESPPVESKPPGMSPGEAVSRSTNAFRHSCYNDGMFDA